MNKMELINIHYYNTTPTLESNRTGSILVSVTSMTLMASSTVGRNCKVCIRQQQSQRETLPDHHDGPLQKSAVTEKNKKIIHKTGGAKH